MGTYNLDTDINVDDPGHTEHHEALAIAGNDLDARVLVLEASSGGGSGDATWGLIGGTITDQTDLASALAGKAAVLHGHDFSDISGLQSALDGKASTSALAGKADTVHTHAISGVTGLQTALDGKSATGHSHAISDITALQTALDGKAGTSHTHAISAITGLQTALDGKAGAASTGAAIWIGTSAEYAAVSPKVATTMYYLTD